MQELTQTVRAALRVRVLAIQDRMDPDLDAFMAHERSEHSQMILMPLNACGGDQPDEMNGAADTARFEDQILQLSIVCNRFRPVAGKCGVHAHGKLMFRPARADGAVSGFYVARLIGAKANSLAACGQHGAHAACGQAIEDRRLGICNHVPIGVCAISPPVQNGKYDGFCACRARHLSVSPEVFGSQCTDTRASAENNESLFTSGKGATLLSGSYPVQSRGSVYLSRW